jgi:Spy/CpxP family protein refolding chaperone
MTASLKTKLIAGFLLAFLAGCAAGAFFSFHQARHWRADFGRHPQLLTERMRNRMKDQLDLSPEQLAKIGPILDRASRELQDVRAETGAKVRQVMAETNHALQPELTDAQRAKLEKIQHAGWDQKGLHKPSRRRGAREGAVPGDDPARTPRP